MGFACVVDGVFDFSFGGECVVCAILCMSLPKHRFRKERKPPKALIGVQVNVLGVVAALVSFLEFAILWKMSWSPQLPPNFLFSPVLTEANVQDAV